MDFSFSAMIPCERGMRQSWHFLKISFFFLFEFYELVIPYHGERVACGHVWTTKNLASVFLGGEIGSRRKAFFVGCNLWCC